MTNEIVEIQLDQILLNYTNPRGLINPAVVEALSLSMAADGQKTEIKLMRLAEGQYRVVGGDHRVLAARKLGWTTIRAVVLDISPDQAYLEGYLDNQSQPMGWFADYMAIEALWNQSNKAKGTQKAVADRLMKSEAQVSTALRLMPTLNAGSREFILQALKNGGKLPVTQNAILALTGLATGQPDDQIRVEATLRVLFDHKLTDPHAKALVAWVKAGNPADTFNHQPTPKVKPTPARADNHPAVDSAQAIGQPHPQTVALTPHQPAGNPKASGPTENIFMELLAGISVFSHIRSKVKKNEKLSVWEVMALVVRDLGRALGWLSKHGFKLIGHILKFIFRLVLDALKSTAKIFGEPFYKVARLVVIIAILCGIAWFFWDIYHHGPLHPLKVLTNAGMSLIQPKPVDQPVVAQTTSAPTAQPTPATVAEAQPIATTIPTPEPTLIVSAPVEKSAPDKKTVSSVPVQPTPTAQNANGNKEPLAQSNRVSQPVASTQTPKTDVAGDILKQAGPAVAGDVAKKLFGL